VSTWGKILGAASVGTGILGAAALGGVTAQRRAVRRYRVASGADEPGYDLLAADRTYSVLGDDGVILYVEEVGPLDAPLTVIFGHGWTLRSGAWHYQRLGLADWTPGAAGPSGAGAGAAVRLVFFDQRSHGKSSRATSDRARMADLAGDLAAVMATAAPEGPVVLVGHSMGGMALLALASLRPTLFVERVAGVGLVSTSAGAVPTDHLARALLVGHGVLVNAVSVAVSRYPQLIERGRAGTSDAVWLLTRTLGFARKDVPGELVDYLDEMISGTPIDVITDFLPALVGLDQTAALPVLANLPVVVICGDQDRQTPLARSRAIAAALPEAELVIAEGAGHMAILERPDVVNQALRELFDRAMDHVAEPPERLGQR
jgi:pimeloyl-ACP methyl ester carboxylesterase